MVSPVHAEDFAALAAALVNEAVAELSLLPLDWTDILARATVVDATMDSSAQVSAVVDLVKTRRRLEIEQALLALQTNAMLAAYAELPPGDHRARDDHYHKLRQHVDRLRTHLQQLHAHMRDLRQK